MPLLISGSADLHGSTLNYINEGGDFNAKNREGRNLRFGIREHAMCGIMNGIAYDGIFRASGATFSSSATIAGPRFVWRPFLSCRWCIFSRTIRWGSVRMARRTSPSRLSRTSRGPGPRCDPPRRSGRDRRRFRRRFPEGPGPTLLALSRQNLPNLERHCGRSAPRGRFKGGYVARVRVLL